jgi:hypothetical protein
LKIFKLLISKILNLKITEFQTGTKRSIPQLAKAPPKVLSELYYKKAAFIKAIERKQLPLVQLLLFLSKNR